MSELPVGWTHFSLKDICGVSGGKTPSKANPAFWSSPDIPWVSPKDMKKPLLETSEDKISQLAVDDAGMTLYPKNSVLMVTRSGILQHTFPVALAGAQVTVNQDIKVLRPTQGISPKFSFYMLKSFGSQILSECSKAGTTVQSVDSEKLETFCFPLPPFAEQTRIAQKLDELLARVDTLKASINAIPALLKRFRQSVLAAAVTGRLTEEWREKLCLDVWSSTSWAEVLKNNKDAFKRGPFGSALKKSMFIECGYKVYEQYCPINDDCSFSRYYISPQKFEEMKVFAVEPGDFLISCSGVSLGRITQVPPGSEPGIINQALLRVRLNASLYSDAFFKIVFRSPSFQKDLFDNSTGSAIPNLKGVKELKAMQVPLPTLEEQTEIVRRVEQLFAFADQLEAKVASAKTRIDHLTQSIQAKAFRGELVPQDSNDESASVLLDRIKAQRAAAPKAKRGRKTSA